MGSISLVYGEVGRVRSDWEIFHKHKRSGSLCDRSGGIIRGFRKPRRNGSLATGDMEISEKRKDRAVD